MSEYGYKRVGRFIIPREYPKWYALTGSTPVTVTIQVTRIHVRRYTLHFDTFREAVERITALTRRYPLHWLKTEY